MNFIDVTADKWYFRDISELMDIIIDGTPFYSSFKYNVFKEGKAAIDVDIVANVQGQYEFYVDGLINPTGDTPLTVFVDDIATVVDEVVPDEASNKTYIKLGRGVGVGSVVRVFYAGEPEIEVVALSNAVDIKTSPSELSTTARTLSYMDRVSYRGVEGNWFKVYDNVTSSNGYVKVDRYARTTPAVVNPIGVEYPFASLIIDDGYFYVYDLFEGLSTEVVRFNGRQLRRVDSINAISLDDDYCISSGKIYTNYNLNGKLLEVSFLIQNSQGILKNKYQKLRVRSSKVVYNNYFFPDLLTSKAEAITTLNKLRIYILKRFTDTEPWRSTKNTSRFPDVQFKLDSGSTPWWWEHVRDFEDMIMPDGKYLLDGVTQSELGADSNVTRAEMAALIDKTRIWLLEALK